MAEFCRQCSIRNFQEDYKDFAGIAQNVGAAHVHVLCEGCGPCLVNNDGACVSHGEDFPEHNERGEDFPHQGP